MPSMRKKANQGASESVRKAIQEGLMEEVTFELKPGGQKEPITQTSREREFQALFTCKGPSAGPGKTGSQEVSACGVGWRGVWRTVGRRLGTLKGRFWETGCCSNRVGPGSWTLRCWGELTPSSGLDQAVDTRDHDCQTECCHPALLSVVFRWFQRAPYSNWQGLRGIGKRGPCV